MLTWLWMTSLNCLTENLFLLLMAPAAILYAGESDKIGAKKRWDDVLPTLQVSHSTRRLKKWKSVTEHVFEHVAQSMIKNFPRQRSGGLVVSMLDFYFNNPS